MAYAHDNDDRALPVLSDASVQLEGPGPVNSFAVDCTSTLLMLAGYVQGFQFGCTHCCALALLLCHA
jgi:hypothetical protein